MRFGPGGSEFLRLEWADKAEIERLKRTANFERHARRKFDPLPNPMPEAEARDLLVRLMTRAAKQASPERPSNA